MADLITGLFDSEMAAESAVSQLKNMGYGQNEITIIMKDRAAASDFAHDTENQVNIPGPVGSDGCRKLLGLIGLLLAVKVSLEITPTEPKPVTAGLR
jgi:hypothetical protein